MGTPAPSRTFADPHARLSLDTGGRELHVQLCLSPHCSAVASLLEVASTAWWDGADHAWRARFAARRGDIDCEALAPYVAYPAIPRFLTSALDDPAPTFAAQLDDIMRIPDERVRRDITEAFGDDIPRAYVPFISRPDRAVRRLCEALAQYWAVMVEPVWPRMKDVLQREVLRQAVALTTRPVAQALDAVHPGMRFDGTSLTIASRAQSDRAEIGDRVLMLTPLVSAAGGLLADVHDLDRVKIGYAAPGADQVWAEEPEHVVSQLDAMLGSRRAGILTALETPATTTGLCRRLGLPPATVSGHLSALRGYGLVARSRTGREVEYSLSDVGAGLLELFGLAAPGARSPERADALRRSPPRGVRT